MGFKRSWVRIPPARFFFCPPNTRNKGKSTRKSAIRPFAFFRVFPGLSRYRVIGVMIRSAICTVVVLLVATIVGSAKPAGNHSGTVRLNQSGLDYARKLIAEGRVVKDKHGDWAVHKVSPTDENEFIAQHGSQEYARWHLGIDESHQAQNKARYKYPFGDFKDVHRCALIAIIGRARQHRCAEIEGVA